MTILESVERQLKKQQEMMSEYDDMEEKYQGNKSAMASINKFRRETKAKINEISASITMMRDGYRFTRERWVK